MLCVPWCHSVGFNNITGDAAENLVAVVLEHAIMTDFCGIPLVSLRENSITELDLKCKGVGVPGAIVLSKLLPSAAALTLLKCARPPALAFTSPPSDTLLLPLARSLDGNQLCNEHIHSVHSSSGQGDYTLVGIINLCEALKGSSVASLECAAAP